MIGVEKYQIGNQNNHVFHVKKRGKGWGKFLTIQEILNSSLRTENFNLRGVLIKQVGKGFALTVNEREMKK